MIIKNFKLTHPKIYNRVLELQLSNGNEYNDNLHIGTNATEGNFDWTLTAEGFDVWCQVSDGRMKPWYDYWKLKCPIEENSPHPIKINDNNDLFYQIIIGLSAVNLLATIFLIFKSFV